MDVLTRRDAELLKVDPAYTDGFTMAAKHNLLVDLLTGEIDEVNAGMITEMVGKYREEYDRNKADMKEFERKYGRR